MCPKSLVAIAAAGVTAFGLGLAIATLPAFLPDLRLTPGATLPVTAADVCAKGYAGRTRNVPESEKNAVYKEYDITSRKPGEYEIDHLISLELGGSNDIKNLWPQSYITTPWNAHVKDKLEDTLHADVCSGRITLPEAQHEISTDWVAAYKKRFGDTPSPSDANTPPSE